MLQALLSYRDASSHDAAMSDPFPMCPSRAAGCETSDAAGCEASASACAAAGCSVSGAAAGACGSEGMGSEGMGSSFGTLGRSTA